MYTVCAAAAWAWGGGTAHADIVVDAHADEPEWRQAQTCGDWRRVEPFALDEPRYGNQMSVVATPQGLAAFFVFDHPANERRVKPRVPRDAELLIGESLQLLVDFDANGQIGYEFAISLGGGVRDGVVTNQNEFDRDWDGVWHYALRETDEQWFAEILIPWSSVRMRSSMAERRTIGIYASRFLYDRIERYACPGIDAQGAAFLSDFRRIELPEYQGEALFDLVPYGSLIADRVTGDLSLKAGADVSWKASSQFWLTAALNPDFGQVESDELVVDFSAIETVRTDKRPFFTENQAIFDLRTPANGQLIYTRRIGAASDDGIDAAADIDFGLKLTGAVDKLVYGAFIAREHDDDRDVGRLFAATRLALPLDNLRVGHLATYTQRPFLDRVSLVNALDIEVTPSDTWRFAMQGVRSDIDAAAAATHGYLTWAQLDLSPSAPLRHTLKLLYSDARFDSNDMGYMERNSLRQVEWETKRRVAAQGDRERISGVAQRLYLQYRENDDGVRLPSRMQVSRDLQYTSAWRAYQELRFLPGGTDDLISRGHGPVRIRNRVAAYVDASTPRVGDWVHTFGAYVFQQGVEGFSAFAQAINAWYPHESITIRTLLQPEWSDDWLLWRAGNAFGSFTAKRFESALRLDWIPAQRHELRLKLQWIGIHATPRQAYRTDAAGRLLRSDERLSPFTLNDLGLQVRYRYEIAPMSELFIVYARGGLAVREDDTRGLSALVREIDDLRSADQFLIKLRYRM